jgi:hypothetical protein
LELQLLSVLLLDNGGGGVPAFGKADGGEPVLAYADGNSSRTLIEFCGIGDLTPSGHCNEFVGDSLVCSCCSTPSNIELVTE